MAPRRGRRVPGDEMCGKQSSDRLTRRAGNRRQEGFGGRDTDRFSGLFDDRQPGADEGAPGMIRCAPRDHVSDGHGQCPLPRADAQ